LNLLRPEYLQIINEQFYLLQREYTSFATLCQEINLLRRLKKIPSEDFTSRFEIYSAAGGAGTSAGASAGASGAAGPSIAGGIGGTAAFFGIACLIIKNSATRIIIIRITTPAGLFFLSAIFSPPFFVFSYFLFSVHAAINV